jgi:undecaprenyl-diphosphatase
MTPTTLLEVRATWAGAHALAIFAALLALALSAVWAGCRAMRRAGAGRSPELDRAWPRGAARLLAGGSVVVLGSVTLVELAEQLRHGETLAGLDMAFNAALHAHLPAPALQAFGALTHLGDTATLTALCVGIALALVATGRRGMALGWVVAVAGNGLLNQGLKQHYGRVRPLQMAGGVIESGYSFPSGHSSGALVAYGMLACLALRVLPGRWHLTAMMVAVTLAWTVGASRCILGVHFASDVLAGFASGAAWLALCITGMGVGRSMRRLPVA